MNSFSPQDQLLNSKMRVEHHEALMSQLALERKIAGSRTLQRTVTAYFSIPFFKVKNWMYRFLQMNKLADGRKAKPVKS